MSTRSGASYQAEWDLSRVFPVGVPEAKADQEVFPALDGDYVAIEDLPGLGAEDGVIGENVDMAAIGVPDVTPLRPSAPPVSSRRRSHLVSRRGEGSFRGHALNQRVLFPDSEPPSPDPGVARDADAMIRGRPPRNPLWDKLRVWSGRVRAVRDAAPVAVAVAVEQARRRANEGVITERTQYAPGVLGGATEHVWRPRLRRRRVYRTGGGFSDVVAPSVRRPSLRDVLNQ